MPGIVRRAGGRCRVLDVRCFRQPGRLERQVLPIAGRQRVAVDDVVAVQVPGTGTELVPELETAPGTGGDLDSAGTSVSADGKLIAYESTATDLGGL